MNSPLSQTRPDSPVGVRLGGCLGRGGMSVVWEATTSVGTRVAVKVSNTDVANGAAARALIRREYALLAKLAHRNIVSVLGLIEMDHVETGLGLVMEYVDGGDLVSLTGSEPRRWAPVAARLADALGYLHAEGVVHRDVKARNVLLRPGDDPCLIDFSLAGAAGARVPRGGGTAACQSANQRRGGPAAASDDVHAFAVLLYELWTGELPFGREPALESAERPGAFRRRLESSGRAGLRPLAELIDETLCAGRRGPEGGIGLFSDALELVVTE